MKRAALAGVRITNGPADWQIIQRRLDNTADIILTGTWLDPSERMGQVEVRVVEMATGYAAAQHLDWHHADTGPDRTWRHVIEKIPAGGPYRLETRLKLAGDSWRLAGDSIHHIGVGDLWLIAGDDNALGYGQGPVEDKAEFGVHMFRKNERWTVASHPIHDITGIRNSRFFSAGAPAHSPWLGFARLLHQETGLPIGLIPAAQEGTLLENWHNRKKGGASPAFDNMLALLRLATSMCDYSNFSLLDGGPVFLPKPDHPAGVVAGCVWYHGNADCKREGAAQNYATLLNQFIGKLRSELASPHLPIVICQLNRVIGVSKPGESVLWGKVREAQRAAAYAFDNIATVPTLDASLSDGIHNSAHGNVLVGERAARAALGMVYGAAAPWKAPDFLDAYFEDGERNKVVLEFANISGGLRPVAGEISSLTVADADGGAPIRKVKLADEKTIHILLNRELGEKPVISFCATHNPPLAFVDSNNCPPLAFSDVAIREESEI